MKNIKSFEQFIAENFETEAVVESKSITSISNQLEKTIKEMKRLVEIWKKENDEAKKNKIKDQLKELTAKKKQLEQDLDDAVAELDQDVELEAEE